MRNLILSIEVMNLNAKEGVGVHAFVEGEHFRVMAMTYSADFGPVRQIDFVAGEQIPKEIMDVLHDPSVDKIAWNAQFVRICLSKAITGRLYDYLEPEGWKCLKVWAQSQSLPARWDELAAVLRLKNQQDTPSERFLRNHLEHEWGRKLPAELKFLSGESVDWRLLKQCHKEKLEMAKELLKVLNTMPMTDAEWENYWVNQRINDRGILTERKLVRNAALCDLKRRVMNEVMLRKLTGVATVLHQPNVKEFKCWLAAHGAVTESLTKEKVRKLRKTASEEVDGALLLWQQIARTAPLKYRTIERAMGGDGRVRGLIDFNSGRCGGYGNTYLQVTNLPTCYLTSLDALRNSVIEGNFAELERNCESVPEALSQMLSTAFIPGFGHKMLAAEYYALPNQIMNWLVMNNGFTKLPVNADARTKKYLNEDPRIAQLWWQTDVAIRRCLLTHETIVGYGVAISYEHQNLTIELPSGRKMVYIDPLIEIDREGFSAISYVRYDSEAKAHLHMAHGREFVRDIVNGIQRDLIADVLRRLDRKKCCVVLHHSNLILMECETPEEYQRAVNELGEFPVWAQSLRVACEVNAYKDHYEKSLNARQ